MATNWSLGFPPPYTRRGRDMNHTANKMKMIIITTVFIRTNLKELNRDTSMADEYVFQPMFTYLGNKRKLLDHIEKIVIEVKQKLGKDKLQILDGFTGSTVVARMLTKHASEIHANDLEYYSYMASRCFLEVPTEDQQTRIKNHMAIMNFNSKLMPGIITELYAPADTENVREGERCYFTHENALRIDTWRRYISDHVEPDIQHWCLVPILIQMSLKANTYGHFKAFSKKDGVGTFDLCGDRVKDPMVLELPIYNQNCKNVYCHNESINTLLDCFPENSLDLIYLDPPYNEHEYGAFYFLHNIVLKNERPVNVNAVTGLPKERTKSDYNKKVEAARAMRLLVARCVKVSKFTLISYNDEGIIGPAGWQEILRPYDVRYTEVPYSRYSSNTKHDEPGRKHVMETMILVTRQMT
jgi:adenine-specific DNA-methyltransferase